MLRRDGAQVRSMQSPLASLSGLRETRASAPARAEKWVSKRGTLRFIQAMTPVALELRTPLPSVAAATYGQQVVSSRVQAETRQNSPNMNQARDGSYSAVLKRQVWRTVMAGSPWDESPLTADVPPAMQ